ncbi:uncharacterized protein FIBRA_04826 [Fibroporia radiculosa]|uniref:Uncharacterized protein n=1 Tax=Fibroporia radiculosa TaxID=599839 RepID=J4H362_9APHY|nr:uncharacterized protein FIBRA_04826 [Fibroporia radiculosa]CCM02719.1 predicted protein [Fibroporia radiculosa]
MRVSIVLSLGSLVLAPIVVLAGHSNPNYITTVPNLNVKPGQTISHDDVGRWALREHARLYGSTSVSPHGRPVPRPSVKSSKQPKLSSAPERKPSGQSSKAPQLSSAPGSPPPYSRFDVDKPLPALPAKSQKRMIDEYDNDEAGQFYHGGERSRDAAEHYHWRRTLLLRALLDELD